MHQPQKLGVGLVLALALAAAPTLAHAGPLGVGGNGYLTLQQKKNRVVKQQQITQQNYRLRGGPAIGSRGRGGSTTPSWWANYRQLINQSQGGVRSACGGGQSSQLGLAVGQTRCDSAKTGYNGLQASWAARSIRPGGQPAPAGAARGGPGAPAPPPPDPRVVAATVIARLQLPSGAPKVGPPPSVNKWNMVAVGYPIWLWTGGATHLNDTDADQGLSVSLDATATKTTFSMGDGSYVTCNPATARKWVRGGVKPGTPSPTCGYRYEEASMKKSNSWKGTYTVTATTTWQVDWAAGGETGTVFVPRSSTVQIPVGELQAIRTR